MDAIVLTSCNDAEMGRIDASLVLAFVVDKFIGREPPEALFPDVAMREALAVSNGCLPITLAGVRAMPLDTGKREVNDQITNVRERDGNGTGPGRAGRFRCRRARAGAGRRAAEPLHIPRLLQRGDEIQVAHSGAPIQRLKRCQRVSGNARSRSSRSVSHASSMWTSNLTWTSALLT